MTMIDKPATTNDGDTATAQVEHPAWCYGPHACTAEIDPRFPTLPTGDNLRLTNSFQASWGSRAQIGIVKSADTRDDDDRRVLLALPFDNQVCTPRGMTDKQAADLDRKALGPRAAGSPEAGGGSDAHPVPGAGG